MLGIPLISQLVINADEINTEGNDEYSSEVDDSWAGDFGYDGYDLDDDYPAYLDFDLDFPEDAGMLEFLPSTGIIIDNDASIYSEVVDGIGMELLMVLPVNTNVQLLESDDDWYQIKIDDQIGWIHGSNIRSTIQIAVVLNEGSPFKENDESDANILFELSAGMPLRVEALAGDWVQTTINDETGWIHIEDLAFEDGRRPGAVIDETTIHEEPNESSTVIRELPLGYQVMIIQRTRYTDDHVSWSQVAIRTEENEDLTGWIQTSKLIYENQIRYIVATEAEIPLLTFTREGYNTLREITVNSQVTVIAEAGLWRFLSYDVDDEKFYGWIDSEFLSTSPAEVEEGEDNEAEEPEESEEDEEPIIATRTAELITLRHLGVTVVDDVSLREGPGTEYRRLGRIPANTNVQITARLGSWNRIIHNGEAFWVRRSALRRTVQRAIVTGDNVPVRASASSGATTLTRAAHGTRVSITQRDGSWARVTVNNQTGWIRTNQLRTTNGRVPGQTTVATDLRVRPNANSPRSRRLTRGQEVMLVQRTTNGTAATAGWTQVVVIDAADRSYTGWVRTEHVERGNYRRRIGGASEISVRRGPSSSYNRIPNAGRIPRNTSVTVLAEAGNWSRIRFDRNGRRHYGWVRSRNVMPIYTMHHEIETALRNLQAGRNRISMSYFCLTTGRRISINGSRSFFSASTFKLPTNMLVAEAVHEGRLTWNQRVTLMQSDWLGGSGILQNQATVGQQFTVYELMRLSIVYSDNIAHRMLARTVLPGFQNDPIGLDNSRLQLTHAIFDRYLPGHQRPTGRMMMTPNQLTEIYRIFHRDMHRIEGFRTILHYQRNTSWNDRFVTNLTNGHVAHTPGWNPPHQHDSGTFFTDHPYTLVVYTEGVGGVPFLSQVANEIFRINRRFDN